MINRPLYVDKIMAYTDTPFVKVLTGVRRCGKSTVLKMIMEKLQQEHGIPSERIVSMRFDSMDYEDMTAKDMFKAVKEKLDPTGRTYLFLDEVQEIEGWEKVVNSLATDYDVDLYVTGSNSRMMSSEIATYLTGRYVSFRIYTLSFQEYLEFKKQYTQVKDIHAELADYIRLGGFPATHLREYSQDEVYTIVRDIYNSTIFSDIVKRNQIRKIDQLERVVRYTFANVGNSFSAKSISDSGRILIDGVDIAGVTIRSLRKQMGVMMQDSFIFSGTIMDNIRYGNFSATDEEVIRAAKTVCAHDFIMEMENGYQTQVNERGSRLSAGQRQLISFARALLADPKILILDEATSSIDTETEIILQKGLNELLKGRTSFIIAHRLSTIKNSSCIMYVDKGTILEKGTHDELMAQKGEYYKLYMSQYASLM